MPDPYTATGKQVLCDGRHFCDAATPEIAANVAAILNAYVEASPISFAEAERVGERLSRIYGDGFADADDLTAWADLVQTTLRFTRDVIAEREAVDA